MSTHGKTGARMSKHPLEPKVQLPGQPSLEKLEVMRVTQVTFLPTCSLCRNYPAYLVNGKWICRSQHD